MLMQPGWLFLDLLKQMFRVFLKNSINSHGNKTDFQTDEILSKWAFNKQMALIVIVCLCTFKSKGSVKVHLIQKPLNAELSDLLPTPSVRCCAAGESGLR